MRKAKIIRCSIKQRSSHHQSLNRHRSSSKVIHVRVKSFNKLPSTHLSSSIHQKNTSLLTTKTIQVPDYRNIPNDHHRRLKRNKAKKCLRRHIIAALVIGFLLITIILVTTLILFLMKPTKEKNIYSDQIAVLRWHSEGITIAGISNVSGNASYLLNYPYDLVVDWSYALYVADRENNRIQKFLRGSSNATTVAGRANGTAGSSADAFNTPSFLLVDDNGNIHVSDTLNHRVMLWKKDATAGIMVAGNGTAGNSNNQLYNPRGLAYDHQSNTLFVSDFYNYRLMKYLYNNSSGILVGGNNTPGTSRTQLWCAHGLFYEQSSNSVLIANAQANNIVQWVLGDSQWSLVVGNINGTGGSSPSLFSYSTDILLDPMNNIYVVDRSNHRVQFFPVGQLNATTIAGKTGQSGSGATLLNAPNSLTLDNQLNLYVADWQNHRIQKFLRY